jgi:hypothetical protein
MNQLLTLGENTGKRAGVRRADSAGIAVADAHFDVGVARALSFAPRSYSLAWLPNQSPAAGYRIAP